MHYSNEMSGIHLISCRFVGRKVRLADEANIHLRRADENDSLTDVGGKLWGSACEIADDAIPIFYYHRLFMACGVPQ